MQYFFLVSFANVSRTGPAPVVSWMLKTGIKVLASAHTLEKGAVYSFDLWSIFEVFVVF